MAFNGSGVFQRLYNWVTDRNNNIKIRADRMDAELDGFATGLSNCITKDGQTTVSANIPFNDKKITGLGDATSAADALNQRSGDARYLELDGTGTMTGVIRAADGTVSAPGVTFGADLNSGLYRIGTDNIGAAVNGTKILDIATTGLGVTGAISGTTGTFSGAITMQSRAVDAFPSGTKMLFQQTSAPTGWTKDTTHDNKALRVVTGTASSGGSTAFTSVFAARTITADNLPVHTHAAGTLAAASAGDHTHQLSALADGTTTRGSGGTTRLEDLRDGAVGNDTATTTTNGAHTHTITGNTGNNTTAASAMDFAVQYVDVVICTKD
jgi:hypothetical protein